jgi:hypothetical protein
MSTVIDRVLQRFDIFMARFQPVSRVRGYRQQPFQNALQKPRPVALFGATPDGFALDYVTYRAPSVGIQGAINPAAPRYERENPDGEINLETWKPNPNVPSLISHGKRLDYSRGTDQEPIRSFSGTIDEKWDGLVRNIPKRPDFQSVRTKREPTIADAHAEDIRKTGYDFY